MKYRLEVKPAILPAQRHKIEKTLEDMGFNVRAGGTHTDMSACDIAFSKPNDPKTCSTGNHEDTK